MSISLPITLKSSESPTAHTAAVVARIGKLVLLIWGVSTLVISAVVSSIGAPGARTHSAVAVVLLAMTLAGISTGLFGTRSSTRAAGLAVALLHSAVAIIVFPSWIVFWSASTGLLNLAMLLFMAAWALAYTPPPPRGARAT